jgi:sRNA-binding protein
VTHGDMMRGMRRWVLAMAVVAGCGPVAYINQVTRRADDSVERARQADADKYSPYWWTRATQYLHMAREVAAHADFQGANRFGRLAAEAADKATEQSEDPSKHWVDPHKTEAPAKDDGVAPAKNEGMAPAKDEGMAPAKDTAPAKPAKDEPDDAAPAKPASGGASAKGAG